MALKSCLLTSRGVLKIEGADRLTFLQGLISNDVNKLSEDTIVYSAFLTPQGKFLCDFFLFPHDENALLVDIETDALAAFKKKLTMFKLRADVKITDVSEDYDVWAAWGDSASGDNLFQDPRLEAAGYRAILVKGSEIENSETAPFEEYDLHRITLSLPDGSRDMTIEKSILLENGFDELNGVDWDKGCYMGQELTARTKYRALIKKRLVPVTVEGDLPEPGSDITSGDKVVGEMRSGAGNMALATLRLEAFDLELSAGSSRLTVQKPDWLTLPETE